jgi:hypothetical protein
MLVCLVFRATRPIAWGLLLMLLVGPFLGVFGFLLVAEARHPRSTGYGAVFASCLLAAAMAYSEAP